MCIIVKLLIAAKLPAHVTQVLAPLLTSECVPFGAVAQPPNLELQVITLHAIIKKHAPEFVAVSVVVVRPDV